MHLCLSAAVGDTGGNARISGQNVYGKTGTTSSNRDRWFCGYTEYYTAAVWFGFDTPEDINLVMGNGNNPAAILFSKVLSLVHTDLPKVELINYNKMRWTSVCLDSGKAPTEACLIDVRTESGLKRTDSALVYPEDVVTGACDKHVAVDYCVTGGGVATDYCKLFAAEPAVDPVTGQQGFMAKVEQRALVKMTEEEFEELVKAKTQGLLQDYLRDDYIYLTKKDGKDASFKGINGDVNAKVDAPYLVCPDHTKEAWEAYQASIVPETEPTEDDGSVG